MSDTDTPDLVAALDATDPTLNADDASPAADAAPADDPEVDAPVEGEDELGDAGKKALDRMKERLKSERARRVAAEQKLNESAPADDPERVLRDAEAAAMAKANTRILSAEVRAAAAGKLSDPSDALTFIDLSQFDVDDDGSVDETEIADAIADLLRKKPYLAAQGGPSTPKPDPSQGEGSRGTASTAERFASQLNGLL